MGGYVEGTNLQFSSRGVNACRFPQIQRPHRDGVIIRGRRAQPPDRNGAEGLRRAFSLGFQAGEIAAFTPWRGGAEPRAGIACQKSTLGAIRVYELCFAIAIGRFERDNCAAPRRQYVLPR